MRACSFVVLSMLSGASVAQVAAQMAQQQLLQQQITQQQQQQLLQQQITQQQLDLINQQQLNQNVNASLAGYHLGVRAPQLKQEAGTEPGTVVLHMEDRSRGASIFYTVDGWTPTAASERYMGPVTLRRSVTVRAIALAAGGVRSYVSVLPIDVSSKTPVNLESHPVRIAQLSSGTKIPLVFSASVSSRGQKVGNRLPVSLEDDLFVGGKLAAQKGAIVEAVVTQVDNSHVQGLPAYSVSLRNLFICKTAPRSLSSEWKHWKAPTTRRKRTLPPSSP